VPRWRHDRLPGGVIAFMDRCRHFPE